MCCYDPNPAKKEHPMTARSLILIVFSLILVSCEQPGGQKGGEAGSADQATGAAARIDFDIPYEKFTLENGLRVIVHEDRGAPIVAVNIWYHVGSKDEPEGRTGFAHLFEHLMFNGSENFDEEYFGPLELVGASVNGNTWFDRTMYYEVVPTPALELALWMESDRMGHLLGVITKEKLDEQRAVVQNEKREGDNQPYGMVEYSQLEGMFPLGHPYRHSTIGSMEDLDAATLEDVKEWFQTYYGAANTVLVLSGDVDAATARSLAEKYFGDIPAGPPVGQMQAMVPSTTQATREVIYDRVPQVRINRSWSVAPRNSEQRILLGLAASVLGDGKNSRLYQELIYKNPYAVSVSVSVQPFELTSFFEIEVLLQPGVEQAVVEGVLDEVLADFVTNGPTPDELNRVQTGILAGITRGLESVNGKAGTLGRGELYAGDPGFYRTTLGWIRDANVASVRAASARWLNDGFYQITIEPFPEYQEGATAIDRSTGLPQVGEMPQLVFPQIKRATLDNGMTVVLAERHNLPLVNIAIQFDAGYAADHGNILGRSSFALSMMDEGTTTRDALQISAEAEMLGARISTGSNLDVSTASLSALKVNLAPSLALFGDIVRNPAFAETEIERLRPRWLASIEQEFVEPISMAIRILPPMLFGEDHAYGIPLTGSGSIESISALTRDDLVQFHNDWIRPDNATFFVVGDITMAETLTALNTAFGDWQAPDTPLPTKNITAVELPDSGTVVIVDQPGSPQTLILAGHVAPPTGDERSIGIDTMVDILGGQFTSRMNMNLREDKGWAYGAYSLLTSARGQRMYLAYAPVQTDKTTESITEIMNEMTAYLAGRPATENELFRSVSNATNSLPGAFASNGAVLGSLLSASRFGRPDDYVTTLTDAYRGLSINQINNYADDVLAPNQMVWLIVGDRALIEEGVRSLNLGKVIIWGE
jgi:zinc protease